MGIGKSANVSSSASSKVLALALAKETMSLSYSSFSFSHFVAISTVMPLRTSTRNAMGTTTTVCEATRVLQWGLDD